MKTQVRISKNCFTDEAERIFCAAAELSGASERQAFVERVCAGNEILRANVVALLSTQEEAGEFFDEPGRILRESDESLLSSSGQHSPGGGSPTTALTERIGMLIGSYKLVEVLGEGGCGVVYMADQEVPFHRRVALKIIKLGMDTKSVIARFEGERQALALMDHPNIAHVLDAGSTDAGRPYFVMELVQGTKLTTFCDANRYDTRQRLSLFIKVCHAIQHAHQKGIIHRDIKPSNILVALHDGLPMPMVIDFGIAKAIEGRLTDQTLFTPHEQFVGTPAYMSPEQAQSSRIDVDTRTDVYSLGVLLYELLTGRTPFESDHLVRIGIEEMRRTLLESEPPRPSSIVTTLQGDLLTRTAQSRQVEPVRLAPLLRGDLDWIVMKALEKDRNRRYQTANALAMDVQRFLDNEPIVARPPSRVYQLQKLVRRNKGVFASGAALTLCLAVGFAVVTVLLIHERDLRERAVAAEKEQARLRVEAERGMETEAELRRQAEWRENVRQAAVLLGREAYSEADQVIAQLPTDPTTMEGAQVLRTLGEWNAFQGRWSAARDRFHALQRVSRFDTPNNTSLDAIRSAVAYIESGDRAGYDDYCHDGVALLAGTEDQVVVNRIVKNSLLLPASKELLRSLEPAAQGLKQSLNGADLSAGDAPWQIPWRCLTLAIWEYRNGNPSEAQIWCERCMAGGEVPPPRTLQAQTFLAMSLYKLGQIEAAQSVLAEARTKIEARFEIPLDPGNQETGVWFDWVGCRIFLREATGLIKPAD